MPKRGRKPKGEYQGKSVVFSTRLRADTKKALEVAAEASGRSLSQEAEHRLRRSFDEDRTLFERFGGRENYAVLRLIGTCLDSGFNPLNPDASWRDDPYVFQQTLEAVTVVLKAFRPPGDPNLTEGGEMPEAAAPIQGIERASIVLDSVATADKELQLNWDGERNKPAAIKDGLGDLAGRLKPAFRGNAKDHLRRAEELEKKEEEEK